MIGFASPRLTGLDSSSMARLDFAGDRRSMRCLAACSPKCRTPISSLTSRRDACDQVGDCSGFRRSEPGVSQRRRGVVALHEPSAPLRISNGRLQSRRRGGAVPSRPCPPSRDYPQELCLPLTACCFANCLPDVEKTTSEFGIGNAAVAETRLARALFDAYGIRPSLLLDCRNMVTGMNGTTSRSPWGVSVGCTSSAPGGTSRSSRRKRPAHPTGWQSHIQAGRLRRSCRRVNLRRPSDSRSPGTSRK